jgi:hypothetical protein
MVTAGQVFWQDRIVLHQFAAPNESLWYWNEARDSRQSGREEAMLQIVRDPTRDTPVRPRGMRQRQGSTPPQGQQATGKDTAESAARDQRAVINRVVRESVFPELLARLCGGATD